MFKQFIFLFFIVLSAFSHNYVPPSSLHGNKGLLLPQIQPYQPNSNSNSNSVIYNRFCKALCLLYVPQNYTCGTNNVVYENECMAKCDRVEVDSSRLKFNNKCCCQSGEDEIKTSTASDGSTLILGVTPTIYFMIPRCLMRCLDVYGPNDVTAEAGLTLTTI